MPHRLFGKAKELNWKASQLRITSKALCKNNSSKDSPLLGSVTAAPTDAVEKQYRGSFKT